MSIKFKILLNIKMLTKLNKIISCTWSIKDGDWGSSKKTTCCADEKSSPTPPAVIPIIATLTWSTNIFHALVSTKRQNKNKSEEITYMDDSDIDTLYGKW